MVTLDIGQPTAHGGDGFEHVRKTSDGSRFPNTDLPFGGDIPPIASATSDLIPAANACIDILSGTIARLEFGVREKGPGGESRPRHPLSMLLQNPNKNFGKLLFWEMMGRELHSQGNALAWIERRNGFPVRLHPAEGEVSEERPDGWWYNLRIGGDQRLGWSGFSGPPGIDGMGGRPVHQSDVLHLRGPGLDWRTNWSPSPVEYVGRYALRTYMQSQIRADAMMRRGAHHSHHVTADKEIPQDAVREYAQVYRETYQGFVNAGLPPFLPPGFDIKLTGLSSRDIQLIELLKFTITDIARIWKVPLFLLQHFEQSTGGWANSNLSQQWENFVRFSLRTHIFRFTDEIDRKLMPFTMRRGQEGMSSLESFIDTEPLVSGDLEQKALIAEQLVSKAAVWTPEEAREYTGKPRKPKPGESLRQPTGAPSQDPGGGSGGQRRPKDSD